MKTQNQRTKFTRIQGSALLLVVFLGLASCASTPLPPTQELQAAELAISGAEQNGVADNALPELNVAREKLVAARIAVIEEDMSKAGYLATESKASADLATAQSEMLKAKAVNQEIEKNIDMLKLELERNIGVTR